MSQAAGRRDAGIRHDAAARNDAGTRSDSGETHAAKDGAAPLPATSIGKACAGDADCDGATCAQSFFQFRAVDPAPGGYCTRSCSASADCGARSACVGGRFGTPGHCSIACKDDGDCRAGYYCAALTVIADAGASAEPVTATCQPHPQTDGLADGIVGAGCAIDSDCDKGSCLLDEPITGATYPDGYCTGRCVEDKECGARGVCSPGFLGAVGVCYRGCADDAACGRDGYRCRDVADAGICAPGPKPLPDHSVGKACKNDNDCGGGPMTCASEIAGNPARDGYCTQRCAVDADCGAGGTCISGVDIVVLSSGACYASCMPPGGCRAGYACRSLSGATSDKRGVCAPEAPSDAGMP